MWIRADFKPSQPTCQHLICCVLRMLYLNQYVLCHAVSFDAISHSHPHFFISCCLSIRKRISSRPCFRRDQLESAFTCNMVHDTYIRCCRGMVGQCTVVKSRKGNQAFTPSNFSGWAYNRVAEGFVIVEGRFLDPSATLLMS